MPEEMTLKETLEACHSDELDDVAKYEKLAKEAYEHGYETASGVLNDIATEERTHAMAIAHILEKEVC